MDSKRAGVNIVEKKETISNKEDLDKVLLEGPPKILVPSIRDYYIDGNGSVRRRFKKRKK